jgi:acyl-CoA ligase (AMP-forming) (exosortase A-associated)
MDFLLHHMLRSSAERYPEKEALAHGAQRLTYREVAAASNGLAHGLRMAGVERGDRVGILLEPSVAQVISIFGVSQADAAFVPINHVLFPEQVGHIIADCRMKGLITTREKLDSLRPFIGTSFNLSFIVVVDGDGSEEHDAVMLHRFEDLCAFDAATQVNRCIDKDLAAILYTSGSTGKPKGVMLSHGQIMAGASIVSSYLGITNNERILAVLPFTFDAGLNQLMTAFQQGGSIVLTNFSFARQIVQILDAEKITGLAGVPTVWALLAQPQSGLHKTPLPNLRYITNTGGAMPQAVLATLRRLLNSTQIFLMYGITEAFRATYLPPSELDRRPTSMGKAIPNTEIMLINEQGRLCEPGEIGELVQRGPTVSLGYWERPELNERVFRPHPFAADTHLEGEKVCYSGDLVKMDEDGFLYFVGRRDAMIKSSGYRISPTEIEEVLFQTGQIRGAAVIGVPDELLGQHIKAFVVAKDGAGSDSEMLIQVCAERLPRHMIPKAIEFMDELPKTSTGKVDYPALRALEAKNGIAV